MRSVETKCVILSLGSVLCLADMKLALRRSTSARRLILVDLYMYTRFPRRKDSSNLDLALVRPLTISSNWFTGWVREIVTLLWSNLISTGMFNPPILWPLSVSNLVSYLREPQISPLAYAHFMRSWRRGTAVPVLGRTGEQEISDSFYPTIITQKRRLTCRNGWAPEVHGQGLLDKDLVLIIKAGIRSRPPSSSPTI